MKLCAIGVLTLLAAAYGGAAFGQGVAPSASAAGGVVGAVPVVGGAYLGMTMPAWRALPPPPLMASEARPSCSGASISAGVLINRSSPVICVYLQRLGRFAFPVVFKLTTKYWVRNPTYTFVGGRLSVIEFQTSIDAFDALMARFTERYGAVSQTLRRSVLTDGGQSRPGVEEIWRLPGQSIHIIDPSERADRLAVRIAEDNGAIGPAA